VLFARVSGIATPDAEETAGLLDASASDRRGGRRAPGRVNQHAGDTVMALWGTESSREDDA